MRERVESDDRSLWAQEPNPENAITSSTEETRESAAATRLNDKTQTYSTQKLDVLDVPLVCKSCGNVNGMGDGPVSVCGFVALSCIQALFSLDREAEGFTPTAQMERIRNIFLNEEYMEALATTTESLKGRCRQSVPDLLKPPSLFSESLVLSEKRALIDESPIEDQILSAFRPLLFFSEDSALAAVVSASSRDLADEATAPIYVAAFFRFHSPLIHRFALIECLSVDDSPAGQVQMSFFETDSAVCSHVANALQQQNLVANEVCLLTYGSSCTVLLDETDPIGEAPLPDRHELPEIEGIDNCQGPRGEGQANENVLETVPVALFHSPELGVQQNGGQGKNPRSMVSSQSSPAPPSEAAATLPLRIPVNDMEDRDDNDRDKGNTLSKTPLAAQHLSQNEVQSNRSTAKPLPPQPSGSSRVNSPRKPAANDYSWMLSLQEVSIVQPLPPPKPETKHTSQKRANTVQDPQNIAPEFHHPRPKPMGESEEIRDALREMFKKTEDSSALKRFDGFQARAKRRQSSDDVQELRGFLHQMLQDDGQGEPSNRRKSVLRDANVLKKTEEPRVHERSRRSYKHSPQAKPKPAEASSSSAAPNPVTTQFYDSGQLDLLFGSPKPRKAVRVKESQPSLREEEQEEEPAGKPGSRRAGGSDTDNTKSRRVSLAENGGTEEAAVSGVPLSEKAKQKRRASLASVDSFGEDHHHGSMTARGAKVGESSNRSSKTPRGDTWSPLSLRPELATKASILSLRSEGGSQGEGERSSSKLSPRTSQQSLTNRPPRKSYADSRNEFAWQLALVSKVIKPSDEYLKQQEQKFIEHNPRYKPEKFECLICFETVQGVDGSRCMNCEHSFCRDCLTGHVRSQLQENVYPVLCPVCFADPDRTSTRGYVDDYIVEELDLTAKEVDKFGELQEAAVIVKIDCPGCKQNLVIAREDYLQNPFITCNLPGCDSRFCRACLMVMKGSENQHECKIDQELDALMKEHGWRYCPGCRTPIQKDSGCNHMTCKSPGCTTHFCYVCGKSIWSAKSTQSLSTLLTEHYRSCNQFDEDPPRALFGVRPVPGGARQRRDNCVVQ